MKFKTSTTSRLSIVRLTILLTVLSQLTIGCSDGNSANKKANKKEISHISAATVLKSKLAPAKKANELSEQADQMVAAQAFEEAKELVDLALKENPADEKAAFLKAALEPMLLMKGFYTRIQPLAQKTKNSKSSYLVEIEKIKASDKTALAEFLLDGTPDIQTEADLQSELDKILSSLEKFKNFLKSSEITEITLNAKSVFVDNINERFAAACEIKETANLEYELICPPSEKRHEVTLNKADFVTIQYTIPIFQTYFSFYSAYSLTGLTDVAKSVEDVESPSAQMVHDKLFENPQFAKLRPENMLGKIQNWALEEVEGLRWSMNHQSELCPTGESSGRNRPQKLFNTGACYPSLYKPMLDQLEEYYKGKPLESKASVNGKSYVTESKPVLFLKQPVQDLRQIGPFKFNKCNLLESVGDPTVAGVYPNGDANKILAIEASACDL